MITMRKYITFLLSFAAVFIMGSCRQNKLIDAPTATGDGNFVDATFSVALGSQTKAFSDGTTVDRLYVGIYEIGSNNEFIWVADNADAPATISSKTASVTFSDKIVLGRSYKVVFWAQKQGAPYFFNWAKDVTTGPTVTVLATGDANDEARDAFFGTYETGTVTSSIDLTYSPITLKRPFAQVNVLVQNSNIADPTAAVFSSMTVAQAPTVLNLATRVTGDPVDWTYTTAIISEAAFGSYASTHKYVAMNYVLVDQTAADARYNVSFSVSIGSLSAINRAIANVPLKPNGRCNIVGNIFDENFNITIPIIIDSGYSVDKELTTVTVTVGQNPGDPVLLDAGYNTNPSLRTAIQIEIAVSHPIEVETDKPQITVNPATVASAEWNLTTGKLDVTPLVPNGAAVITLVFPPVTKTDYSEATVQIYVRVGTGINPGPPDFTTVAELKALLSAEPDIFAGTLTDAVVSFIAGTSDAVIKDATGSILYHKESGHGLLQGQTISGEVIVEAKVYNGVNQITDLAATVQGEGTAVEPEVVTLAQLAADYAKYESAYVKVIGVTSNTTTTTKGNISATQDGTNYIIYTNVAIPVNSGDIFTAEGTVTKYNTTEELKVWKAADLTVTTAVPVLSASPAGMSVSATTTSVTWTITSNTDWTITPGAGVTASPTSGNGNADVTLTFAENTGDEDVTYTAMVSAAGCDDVTFTITQSAAGGPTPDFTTIAELKALLGTESATFTGTLTDAVVSFVAGTSDAVIKDATGSILYHTEIGHNLLQGQTISGDVIIEAEIYNGVNQITDLAATVEGWGSAVEPEVVTLAQLVANYAKYESAYVKVVGVTSNTTTTKKGNIEVTQDGTNYVVYTNVAIPVKAGDIFTAEGTVTKYNTTEELKVWKHADLTVTTEAPVLSATPTATTVAATTTSVTWNITSNTDWTITPGEGVTPTTTSGNGNAEVTLSFAANEGTEAATYTATVSAEGCDDVTITITQNGTGSSSTITDVLTSSLFTALSTTYTDFSNVAATSSARYAGNTAKSSSGGIQMRSKNSNSGIVSTVSGGKVKSVKITVESGSNTIDVYGNNTAYTGAGDLFATGEGANQGTKVGSLTATGTITFTDDYTYVGIRSNNGSVYITMIEIEWE